MMTRKKLTVRRKGHKRQSYVKDVKRGRRVKLKRIPATTVKPATFQIKDIGAVGRGKKVIKITRRGALKRLGYSTKASPQARREALRKADRKFGSQTLFRMLQAQVVLRKRIQPRARKVFEADRNWVEKTLMSAEERRAMTRPAVKKWKRMTHAQRVRARKKAKKIV